MSQNSEDMLPPGWTVKVKVRKNGKRDKFYFEPSSQMRFNSRAEVTRYLKTAEVYRSESIESKALKQPEKDVEFKKTIAEGLPPGWIKEVRVSRTANRIRRDSYYIDPISGNVLRSLKDVHQYLTTGKVKRFAYKSRNHENSGIEFDKDDTSVSALKSPSVSKKEMLAIGKARRQIIWGQHSSEPGEITKDEDKFKNALRIKESMSFSEPNSGHGTCTELHCSNLPEAQNSKQSGGKNDSSEIEPVLTPDKPLSLPHKYTKENGSTKNESKKRQRKDKDINLPRRASKRLAGIQADPMLEIKTGRRAHPIACKEPDKQEAGTTERACQYPENLEVKHETKSIIDHLKSVDIPSDSCRKEIFGADLFILPKHAEKVKSEDASEQPKWKSVLPLGKKDALGKHLGTVKSEDKTDVKLGPFPKLPMDELLTDPCIAFAIKTLSGGALDASISLQVPPMPNYIEFPSAVSAAPNGTRISKPDYKLGKKQGCSTKSPSPDLPGSEVGTVESDNVIEKLGSTVELPVGELMADPCIEFAIKTLTGEIPLDNNPDIEDYFQQQLSSSKTQGTGADTMNTVVSNHSYRTNVLSQQICLMEKQPIQALVSPPNNSFQSCGTALHQHERTRH